RHAAQARHGRLVRCWHLAGCHTVNVEETAVADGLSTLRSARRLCADALWRALRGVRSGGSLRPHGLAAASCLPSTTGRCPARLASRGSSPSITFIRSVQHRLCLEWARYRGPNGSPAAAGMFDDTQSRRWFTLEPSA